MTHTRSTWLTFLVSTLVLLSIVGVPAHAATPARGSGACAHSPKAKPKGEIRYSDWQFPATLNTDQTNLGSAYITDELMNDDLVRYDWTGHLYPMLLTSVPTRSNGGISQDGKTIYLHLKPGLHWSNGAEMTAHQIWFAWKIDMDPLSGPACLGTCDKIASISLPSKYEAILHMRHVYASAVPRALPGIMIETWHNSVNGWAKNNHHQAAFALYQDPNFNFTNWTYPTTGPYQVISFKQFDHITLAPNPHYTTMSCGARVAKITFTWYPTKTQMIAAAARRQTDITFDYHPADLRALRKSAGPYKIYDVPGFVYEHLELNVDSQYKGHPNPLSNQTVRQALALATDKAGALKKALGVTGSTAQQIGAYNPWVWRSGLRQPYTDTAIDGQWDPVAHTYVQAGSAQAIRDARKLLKSTRWKSGFALEAVTTKLSSRQKVLTRIASGWTQLGVKTTISQQPDDALFGSWAGNGTLAHGRFQVALFSWVGSPDPDSWVNEMGGSYVDRKTAYHSDLNQNYSGFKDGIIDRGFRQGAGTYSGAKRGAAYKAVQVEMNKQAYWIGLYYRDQISTSDGRVKNFKPNPTTAGVAWNAYGWSR